MRGLGILLHLVVSSVAVAGGYDTPMLYAGEHMGLGGAAVAGVDDPSALFHNPAGLAQVRRGKALFHITYLSGDVTGSPGSTPEATSITSEPTQAPFPLIGVAYRVRPKLVVGLGAFPIASAGASYVYETPLNTVTDSTTLIFAEAGPALALDLGRIRLGAGYRLTYLMLDRFSGGEGVDPTIDFTLEGTHASGLRLGLQGELIDQPGLRLQAGVSYRHQVVMYPKDEQARAIGFPINDVTSRFILPSRLSDGMRAEWGHWAAALDLEYGFNSLNYKSTLSGVAEVAPGVTQEVALDNLFGWRDALTYRLGLERSLTSGVKLRAGGAYDETTSSKTYPTAFGTPPAPTMLAGVGVGYRLGPWTLDASVAHRRGETEVTAQDLAQAEEPCVFCSNAGDYAISLTGAYMALGYEF